MGFKSLPALVEIPPTFARRVLRLTGYDLYRMGLPTGSDLLTSFELENVLLDDGSVPMVASFDFGSQKGINLAAGSAATDAARIGQVLLQANNLSDLVSVPTARTNLGLGASALLDDTLADHAGDVVDPRPYGAGDVDKLWVLKDQGGGVYKFELDFVTLPSNVLLDDGSVPMTGSFDFNGNKGVDLAAATAAADAVRYDQIDDLIDGSILSTHWHPHQDHCHEVDWDRYNSDNGGTTGFTSTNTATGGWGFSGDEDGVIIVSSGSGTTGSEFCSLHSKANNYWVGNGVWFGFRVATWGLTDKILRWGFAKSPPTGAAGKPTDGIYCQFDDGTDATNIEICTRNASTETLNNVIAASGFNQAFVWFVFEVLSASVKIYTGTGMTLQHTATTNLPQPDEMQPWVYAEARNSTANKAIYLAHWFYQPPQSSFNIAIA